MNKSGSNLLSFFEERALPGMERASNLPLLVAIRSGLAVTIPLVFVGSLAVLVNSFPLPAYQEFMQAAFGPAWRYFGRILWSCTFAVMSLTVQLSVCAHLAEQHNVKHPNAMINPLVVGLVSFAVLLSLIAMETGELSTHWMGVAGLFVALVTAVLSVKLFLFFYSFKKLRLYLPGGTPDFAVPEMFNSLLPGVLTIMVFALGGLGLHAASGQTLHELVQALVRAPFDILREGVQQGMFYIFSLQSLWFLGVHGANVLDPITHDVYGAAMAANELAASLGQPLPHIMTKPFMDVFVFMGGAGTSISLAMALLIFGDTRNQRRLAGVSLLPGIFNLNELLLFGLPVILNPVMLIAFVLTPLVLAVISYSAVASGIVPGTSANVEWTTPIFLNAYLSTGSLKGAALQAVNIAVGVCIYAPFVTISNKINARRIDTTFRDLLARVMGSVSPAVKPLEHTGEAGLLARSLVFDLEHALDTRQGLYLEFQPQMASATGRVVGVEALVRWTHPYYGKIPAPITVALAEGGGFINSLGLWVFDEACAVRRQWLQKGVENMVLAVNLSPLQLDENLIPSVVSVMRKHQASPELLEFELTETAMLGAGANENKYLAQLHMLGLRIAIDDFGMGHTSLKYLKQFPVTTVKVDGSISREVVTNPICADIVASITRLCRARGMACVAEYVETDAQAAVLRTLGVDILQGYRFSSPLKADDCLAFIKSVNGSVSGDR